MARSDYGALVYRNSVKLGRYCNTTKDRLFYDKLHNDNSDNLYDAHAIAGTEEFHVSIYKYAVTLWVNGEKTSVLDDASELLGWYIRNDKPIYLNYSRFRKKISYNGTLFDFRRKKDCFYLEFKDFNGDKWEICYGYGVGESVKQLWCKVYEDKKCKVKTSL